MDSIGVTAGLIGTAIGVFLAAVVVSTIEPEPEVPEVELIINDLIIENQRAVIENQIVIMKHLKQVIINQGVKHDKRTNRSVAYN